MKVTSQLRCWFAVLFDCVFILYVLLTGRQARSTDMLYTLIRTSYSLTGAAQLAGAVLLYMHPHNLPHAVHAQTHSLSKDSDETCPWISPASLAHSVFEFGLLQYGHAIAVHPLGTLKRVQRRVCNEMTP